MTYIPPLPPEEGRMSMAERERRHYLSLVALEKKRQRSEKARAIFNRLKSLFHK
jgi:hypothetical protein